MHSGSYVIVFYETDDYICDDDDDDDDDNWWFSVCGIAGGDEVDVVDDADGKRNADHYKDDYDDLNFDWW